jgi:hypothetical protein
MQQGIVHACCMVMSKEGVSTMNITVIVRTLTPLADAFDWFGIPYHLSGSLAAVVYGKPRTMQGIDVVADIKFSQVQTLVTRLEQTYDVEEAVMRDAIEQRGSFGLVHHDTLQKIEVLLPAYRAYSQVKQETVQGIALEQGSRLFHVASPEDTILTVLERYKAGGQHLPRLWEDIQEILTIQGSSLDLAYLRLWATSLNVTFLLEQAMVEAGLGKP